MPRKGKEKLHIKRFDGVIGVADEHDLPPGAASYAENLDIVTRDGSFVGLPEDEAFSGAHAGDKDIAIFEDGNAGVTYDSATGSLKIVTFNKTGKSTTSAASSTESTGKNPAMAPGATEVMVGMGSGAADTPKWAGTPYHDQFDDGAAGTRIITDARISSKAVGWCRSNNADDISQEIWVELPTATNATTGAASTSINTQAIFDSTDAIFSIGSQYTYYATLVYDGTQEAPPVKLFDISYRPAGIFLSNREGDGRSVLGSSEDAGHDDKMWVSGDGATPSFTNASWQIATGHGTGGRAQGPIEGIKSIRFSIKIRTTDNSGNGLDVVSRRASSVKIYRSERILSGSGDYLESEPRFIAHYFLDDTDDYAWGTLTSTGGSSEFFDEDGVYEYIQIIDDKPGTYTFESQTGYPTDIGHMNINWAASCISNEYHLIGNCHHETLEDTNNYIFRSKPFRYMTFDWTKDYCVIPETPVAMVSYDGRVFAFSSGTCYVINPVTLDIEATWKGKGVSDVRSVTATDAGLFWASNTGIHHYLANEVRNIGVPILRLERPASAITTNGQVQNVGWLDRDKTIVPICVYAPIYDSLMVFYSVDNLLGVANEYPVLMYHVPTNRWSPISDLGEQVVNVHINSDGDVIYGGSGGTFTRMFTGANRRLWRWVSRQLGLQGQVHKYYHAYIGTSLSDREPSLYYYRNDPAYTNQTPAYKGTDYKKHDHLFKYRLTRTSAGDFSGSRDFAVELVDTHGNLDCTDITIIFREIGPR